MAKLSVSKFRDLDEAMSHYLAEVDYSASASSPGVQLAREVKWQEVLSGSGPIIEAEAAERGITVEAMKDIVTAARHEGVSVMAGREAARIRAKRSIREAATPNEMNEALKAYRQRLLERHPD